MWVYAFSPVGTAVELCESLLTCLWVKSIYILRNQPVQLAPLLPPLQGLVCRVRPVGGKLRPSDEVSGPVALTGLCAADKLCVLHGSSVSAGVQPDALRSVIGDARLRGQTRSGHDKQASGSGHKVLQQLQWVGVGGAAGGDKVHQPCRDWGGSPYRCCVWSQDPPWQPHHLQADVK